MANALQFTNFASTTIATASVGTGDVTLDVAAATGALFPTLAGGDYFYATLVDSLTAPTKKEIVKVTARSTDTLTIVRAQDNTTAQTWVTGNYIALRPVAKWFNDTTWLPISGTTNQVNVANSGTAITLSLPQDINDTATPTFTGLNLNFAAERIPVFGGSGAMTTTPNLTFRDSQAEDVEKLKVNGGLSAETLAAWGYPGTGTVFPLTIGAMDPNQTVYYEGVVVEPDFWAERTCTGGDVVSGVENDELTDPNSRAVFWAINKGTGDSLSVWSVPGENWSLGLDQSDNSALAGSFGTILGANQWLRVDKDTLATTFPGNSVKVTHATGGLGYGTGAGGTVTQLTSKSTGVTLSKSCGQITMHNATLNANTTVSFTLTNTAIAAGDVLVLNHISGGTAGAYALNAQSAAGSASINVRNITAGNLGEAIVIAFAVIKAVTA